MPKAADQTKPTVKYILKASDVVADTYDVITDRGTVGAVTYRKHLDRWVSFYDRIDDQPVFNCRGDVVAHLLDRKFTSWPTEYKGIVRPAEDLPGFWYGVTATGEALQDRSSWGNATSPTMALLHDLHNL